MGWASGSSLFSDIIEAVNDCDIDEETRISLYEKLIPIFEDEDCDTLQECLGEDSSFDKVYYTLYPPDQDDDLVDFDDTDGC
jgi:hypothetical protein